MDLEENLEGGGEVSAIEQMKAKHRKEKKEFLAKITSLKHSVPRNDKKRKRDVNLEIENLEKELMQRQEKELAELSSITKDPTLETVPETQIQGGSTSPEQQLQPRVSKASRRREKKMELQKKFQKAAEEDAEASLFAPGKLENEAITACLILRNLRLHEIMPDGDCLYNAVAHQLSILADTDKELTGKDVRRKTAAYIRENKNDFLPFLTWKDGSPVAEIEFEKYCWHVEQSCENGGEWGGEPELTALSNVLERSIEVLQPEGRVTIFGEQFKARKPLVLTYHRHAYSLGEHYNSTEFSL